MVRFCRHSVATQKQGAAIWSSLRPAVLLMLPYSVGSDVVSVGSEAAGVVSSGAEVGSVSVGSVSVGAVAEDSGVVVVLSFGVLLGVVGAVGVVGTVGSADGSVDGSVDGPAVTLRSGVWVLLCCEPVAVISPSFVIEFEFSLTVQLPHLGMRVICVPAAAFTVKENVPSTKICSV